MKNIKAIIFDYDGTLLLENQSTISNNIQTMLTQLKNHHVLIILATGRPFNHCRYLMDKQLVNYIISANGALVTNTMGIFHSIALSQNNIHLFNDFCDKNHLPSSFYTTELLTNGRFDAHIDLGLREAMNLQARTLDIMTSMHNDPIYLMCAFCDHKMDAALKEAFPDLFLSRWHPSIISLLEVEIKKTTGILKVLEHHSILPSECVAVGDGNNDRDMLELVRYGIAVGDNPNLAVVADFTIDSVETDLIDLLDFLNK
ncbi:HAD-IIB family hydrolase [Enterococcus alcedinis]|uniref:Hydrolase n=1 Tax=Enterococcus alcedinis TaxID=1274384 RepID=A0A917JEN9_9ENTE|nr:HAD family hydrolase [Enterococcus alcedinis]MBP2102271.1 Cof subfamily protein (haloacid dehalogenase superfamily) [Enterococcus alcedinis]GGI65830.1 hydrolase [Enterococcus alcedinis]